MSDYISREAFKEKYLCCGYLPEMSEEEFDSFPAADVEPVRHGRWVPSKFRNEIERCSKCGKVFRHSSFYGYKFCPSCGAKMDLEE